MKSAEAIVIDAIESAPFKTFQGYGMIIAFDDIFEECRMRGLDNKEIIEGVIKKLASEDQLGVVFGKEPGFEELMIGVEPIP